MPSGLSNGLIYGGISYVDSLSNESIKDELYSLSGMRKEPVLSEYRRSLINYNHRRYI